MGCRQSVLRGSLDLLCSLEIPGPNSADPQDPAIISPFLEGLAESDELGVGAAGVGVGRLGPGPVGVADPGGAERRGDPEDGRPVGAARAGRRAGSPSKARGRGTGPPRGTPGRRGRRRGGPATGRPASRRRRRRRGSPGQVGAAEGPVEPPGGQPGDRLGGVGWPPEGLQKTRRADSASRRAAASSPGPGSDCAAWSRQKPTMATSKRVSRASGSGGTSSVAAAAGRARAGGGPGGDPADLVGVGLLGRGTSLGGREPRPIASEATLKANAGQPGRLVEPEVDLDPLPADLRQEPPAAPGPGEDRHPLRRSLAGCFDPGSSRSLDTASADRVAPARGIVDRRRGP